MEQYEFNTHTFIAKIWLEETAEEADNATWRGHITHVPSGERRYFEELHSMIEFIIRYLEEMEVRPDNGLSNQRLARRFAWWRARR